MLSLKVSTLALIFGRAQVLGLTLQPDNVGISPPTADEGVAAVALPFQRIAREESANSTSSRISTTVFFPPRASTTLLTLTSAVAPPVSVAGTSATQRSISTVTVPWSPTATSSQSVHVITITAQWPTVTPTVTVPFPGQSTVRRSSDQASSPAGSPISKPTPVIVSVTTTKPPETLAPEVVTVTAPSPGPQTIPLVTVIDTTVTVYVSSGVLTVLPTVTVTASPEKAPDVFTVTVD